MVRIWDSSIHNGPFHHGDLFYLPPMIGHHQHLPARFLSPVEYVFISNVLKVLSQNLTHSYPSCGSSGNMSKGPLRKRHFWRRPEKDDDLQQEKAVERRSTSLCEKTHPYFRSFSIARCSMHGIFTYIWVIFGVNVGNIPYMEHLGSGLLMLNTQISMKIRMVKMLKSGGANGFPCSVNAQNTKKDAEQ